MVAAIGGCHLHRHQAVPAQPATEPTTSAGSRSDLTGVKPPPKPFIAKPKFAGEDQPSILLKVHARSDSPVPLDQYAKQKTYALSAFNLNTDLSAAQVQQKFGPPAQWADYSDLWIVYRLDGNRELWLHFAPPDNRGLLAADVVGSMEDGYTRDRVFTAQ